MVTFLLYKHKGLSSTLRTYEKMINMEVWAYIPRAGEAEKEGSPGLLLSQSAILGKHQASEKSLGQKESRRHF